MIKSIVYLPADAGSQWITECARYCAAQHYQIVAVVHAWADAWRLLTDGRAAVLVTGQRDHLPPDGTPRLEVVSEQDQSTATPVSHLRTARRQPGPAVTRK